MSGNEILRELVDYRKFVGLFDTLKKSGDDQSAKLLRDSMDHFAAHFYMKSNEAQAWNRLRNVIRDGAKWSPDLLRNNVFKVADSLGMKLPSSMFASALDAAWGPTLVKQATED